VRHCERWFVDDPDVTSLPLQRKNLLGPLLSTMPIRYQLPEHSTLCCHTLNPLSF